MYKLAKPVNRERPRRTAVLSHLRTLDRYRLPGSKLLPSPRANTSFDARYHGTNLKSHTVLFSLSSAVALHRRAFCDPEDTGRREILFSTRLFGNKNLLTCRILFCKRTSQTEDRSMKNHSRYKLAFTLVRISSLSQYFTAYFLSNSVCFILLPFSITAKRT